MTVFYYDSKLPTSLQWNIGTQMALPWSSSLDISYVGSHAYNILGQNPDVNSPDLGVAYLAQNQDPTLVEHDARRRRGHDGPAAAVPRTGRDQYHVGQELERVRLDPDEPEPEIQGRRAGDVELHAQPAHDRQHRVHSCGCSTMRMARIKCATIRMCSTSCFATPAIGRTSSGRISCGSFRASRPTRRRRRLSAPSSTTGSCPASSPARPARGTIRHFRTTRTAATST